jgi:hypothetical protein
LKKGPLEVPPRISRQGIAVCTRIHPVERSRFWKGPGFQPRCGRR